MLDTPWRRLAAALFGPSVAGRVLVRIQFNTEPIEAYIAETPGARRRLGLVPFVAAAAARAIATDAPALNGYLKRGRVHAREGVTVSVTAPLPGGSGLVALPVHGADALSASEFAGSLLEKLLAVRARYRANTDLAEYALARVPWPLRRPLFRVAHGLARLGVPMGRFDLAPESFGAVLVTSLETMVHGFPADDGSLDAAYSPLFPSTRDATVIAILPAREVPAVVRGEVVVQRRATLCMTFDHRLVDGVEIGQFLRGIAAQLEDHAALDRPASA